MDLTRPLEEKRRGLMTIVGQQPPEGDREQRTLLPIIMKYPLVSQGVRMSSRRNYAACLLAVLRECSAFSTARETAGIEKTRVVSASRVAFDAVK